MDFRLGELRDKVKDLDMLAKVKDLVVVEVDDRNQCLAYLWTLLKIQGLQMFQWSRAKWLREREREGH